MNVLRKINGVTLIELMVVLVVLSIGIIPIALVQTRSNRDVFESGQHSEALNVANQQMETVKSLGFNNAVSDSGTAGASNTYAWRRIVQPAGFGLSNVTVRVQWQEGGNQRTIQLENLLSMR